MTARTLTARGYEKAISKIDKIHGIDGVYIKYGVNRHPKGILVVENKVDGSQLAGDQMTADWITRNVDRMVAHSDVNVRRTGELIRRNPGMVHKQLWHHDLGSGRTTISTLDDKARKSRVRTENYIGRLIRKRCESKKSYHSLLSGFGTERDDPIDRKKRSKDKMRPVLAFLNHLQGSSQICHVRYLEDLRGLGASYRDGARWNEPGFPIVHFAETPSVAMLEMAHYLPSPRLVPPGYRLGVYEVGDEVALERWHVHDLPEGWDRYPHPRSTRRMGTLWLMRKEAPLLAVPSVAVPGGLESIVLANPNILDEGTVRLIAAEERIYNSRAFASEQGG